MLRYVGYGQRDWQRVRMPTHRRLNWEFQAILQGEAAPTLERDKSPAMRGPCLWIFPPETAHGWSSDNPSGVKIASIHFSSINPVLERLIRQQGWLAAPLDANDVNTISDLAQELWAHYWKPTILGELHASRALATLCLIALRQHPISSQPIAPKASTATVEVAERWILEHIGDDKAISEAAHHAGVSRPQLYRLIRQVRGCSPRDLLLRLRFETAKRLMADSALKLDAVALECGFSNASAFCRAFRTAHGCTPTRWRSEYHILHRQPSTEESNIVEAHSYSPAEMRALGPIEALVTASGSSAQRGDERGRKPHAA